MSSCAGEIIRESLSAVISIRFGAHYTRSAQLADATADLRWGFSHIVKLLRIQQEHYSCIIVQGNSVETLGYVTALATAQ